MFVGIGSYSFPWAISNLDHSQGKKFTGLHLLQYAARHEVKFVQFGDNYPLHNLIDAELNKIRDFALKHGIGIEVGTRRLDLKNIERYVQLAIFYDARFIRMVIDDTGYEPTAVQCIEIIKEALPLLKENKLVLAIENHDRFPSATLKEIILATDPDFIGICLDTANSLGAGESVNEVLNELAPYTINLHVKDILIKRVDHKMGFTVEGVAAGDGIIDIPMIIQRLKQTGRCKTATLELWSNAEPTREQTILKEKKLVRKSLHYLKRILA